MDLSFRIQALQRPEGGREGLFEHLVEVVEKAVAGNGAPPVVVVVRGEVVELVPVQPVIDARIPAGRFLAALSRSRVDDGPHPDAVGLMGRFLLRRRRPDGSPEGPGRRSSGTRSPTASAAGGPPAVARGSASPCGGGPRARSR
jgi:hypothetical protein